MDNLWERSIPFYNVGIKEITAIFKEYDKLLEILDFSPINIGCRNSNYKIHTNKGLFLLRICPLNDTSYKKEKSISDLFSGYLKVPKVLFVSQNNITQRTCLIYEYITGNSLQDTITQHCSCENNIIVQTAENAALIHNHDIINNKAVIYNGEFCNINDFPPFLTWYDLFLDNDVTVERIGRDVQNRVKMLISNKKDDLNTIAEYISFIHSDFRPANMIIDENNDIWIVDWEFSGIGHSLADIGQFFRYSNCFEKRHIKIFEEAYNSISKKPLPHDWYNLSKLRDLVNPLQMIGAKEDLPQKYNDLKNIILDYLGFFGY